MVGLQFRRNSVRTIDTRSEQKKGQYKLGMRALNNEPSPSADIHSPHPLQSAFLQ